MNIGPYGVRQECRNHLAEILARSKCKKEVASAVDSTAYRSMAVGNSGNAGGRKEENRRVELIMKENLRKETSDRISANFLAEERLQNSPLGHLHCKFCVSVWARVLFCRCRKDSTLRSCPGMRREEKG